MEKKPLSLHEKVLLVIVAIAALVTAFYMLVYQPQREQIATLHSDVESKRKEVAQYADFDQTISKANLDAQEYSSKIKSSTATWFSEIKQDEIINELGPKIRNAKLNDSTITFVNTQIAQIASMANDNGKTPTLAETLALAYVTIAQEETEKANAAASGTAPAATTAPTKAPAVPAASPTAAPSGNSKDNPNALPTEIKDEAQKEELIAAQVQKRFDDLNASLAGLSDDELQKKLNEIVHNTVANVQKLTVVITFKDSTYQSILDFIYSIEANNPSIYISDLSYSDSTETYLKSLEQAAQTEAQEANAGSILESGTTQQVSTAEIFNSSFPSSSLAASQIMQTASGKLWTKSKNTKFYTGSVTLTYFAISKMPNQDLQIQ